MAANDTSNSESSLIVRQENEVIVLKSIFGNYCVDLREEQELLEQQKLQQPKRKSKQSEGVGGDRKLPALRLTLFPLNSQSQSDEKNVYVQIDLKIEFQPLYPNKLPKLTLENDRGLSNELKKQLQDDLIRKGKSLLGREMVYELCQEIQEFLYEHNKPPAKSFHEQMLDNQKKLMFNDEAADDAYLFDMYPKKIDGEHDLEEINEAVLTKRELLREEMKQKRKMEKRERLSSSTNSPSSHPKSGNSMNNSESDPKEDEVQLQQQCQFKPFFIEFTEPSSNKCSVNCIKLVKQVKQYSFKVYRGINTSTHDICMVYEWVLSLEKNKIFEPKKVDTCNNELKKIEEELKKLIRINNPALVRYLAFKSFKQPDKPNFIVQLCLTYIEGNTMELFLNKKSSIQYSTLQTYANDLVKILDFLHLNHVFHRDLKASSVYLDNNGNLRLADYSTVKRINNLYEQVVNEAQNSLNANIKTDIHQLGILLLSLSLGEAITDYYPKVPGHLPAEFRSFISKCIYEPTDTKQLQNQPFLTRKVDGKVVAAAATATGGGDFIVDINAAVQSIRATTNVIIDTAGDESSALSNSEDVNQSENAVNNLDDEDDNILEKFSDYSKESRLNTEFNVVGKVGSGAFGEVLKVKNKIDMCTYAIKRIRLNPNSNQLNKLITREIKLLSRLNHENVVRYYSTWIEKSEVENQDTETTETSTTATTTTTSTTNKTKKNLQKTSSLSNLMLKQNNFGVSPPAAGFNDDDDDFSTSFLLMDNNLNTSLSSSSSDSNSESSFIFDNSSNSDSDDDDEGSKKAMKKKKAVVFSLASPLPKKQENKPKSKFFDDDSESVVFMSSDKKEAAAAGQAKSESESKIVDLQNGSPLKKERLFVYIQMEYCKGRTLRDLIDRGLFNTVDRVWCLFREILQGLNHIHELGMIHRDLKPRNVLIDANGRAKIGDFGLATSKYFSADNMNQNETIISTSISVPVESHKLDSISMSGNVGTALYVAPELLAPKGCNKYSYTQKVDIYSLGIMFYEMCFAFSTNMERVFVLSSIRKRDFVFPPEEIKKETHANQIKLIETMLDHDPDKRPSAKDLLRSELVPRRANEIALDELLKESLATRNTNNYLKILKAVFDQRRPLKDDVAYDVHNVKAPSSFKYLQIREYVHNMLTKIFQKNGAFMISYPLLIPQNDLCLNYTNAFQLVDASGFVLSLPYNHRVHFARYVAHSECSYLKRYYIGNVYQLYSEKIKFIGNHPRENTEASYDIVTSTNADFLPEVEILWILNDLVCSFSDLADQEFKLVVNHSLLLNAIILYAGIKQEDVQSQRSIYMLLANYNKLFKAHDANKDLNRDVRVNWLKENITNLGFSEAIMNRLVNFLIKYGTVDRVLSEMKNLTKNETHLARLAKEAINQMKFIFQCLNIFEIKYEINISAGFVLPLIANPFEYNGLMFALYRKKKKKNEYEVLASGGRYDRLVNCFRYEKDARKQYAIGVSIDFEKIVSIINEKSAKAATTTASTPTSAGPHIQPQQAPVLSAPISNHYKNQLAIFACGLNIQQTTGLVTNSQPQQQQASSTLKSSNDQQQMLQQQLQQLNQIDIKNRLNLFKYFYYLFKASSVCTHLVHEKFLTVVDMDNYCKRNSILSYVYLNNSEPQAIQQIARIFQKYQSNGSQAQGFSSSTLATANDDEYSLNNIELLVRSLNNSRTNLKFVDKKYKLNDFLFNLNKLLTDSCTPLNGLSSLIATNLGFNAPPQLGGGGVTGMPSSTSMANLNTFQVVSQYVDLIMNSANTATPVNYSQQSSSQQSQNSILSQVNITLLVESNSRSNTTSVSSNSNPLENNNNSGGSNAKNLTTSNSSLNNLNLSTSRSANVAMKKLESQLITRLTHILQLFSTRTRIELIAVEIPDLVLQQLANSIHLDCDEQQFNVYWKEFLEKLNARYRKQIVNFRLEEILRDLRYKGRSKVFIIYCLKSEQFKIFVAP